MFGAGATIQLFKFRGIRVAADWTWLLVLGYFIVVLSGDYKVTLGADRELTAFGFATGVALMFFGTLVMHEFGHALVARRNGIGVIGIDLWMLGGVAKMDRETATPGVDFRVAAAGPLVTAAVVLATGGLAFALDPAVAGDALRRASRPGGDPWISSLIWLALVNAILLVFNLIPAFPLDGGRIARAIGWKLTGSRERGTVIAGTLGRAFGFTLIGLGVWLLTLGSMFQGAMTIFMGFFLSQIARRAVLESRVVSPVALLTVADVMDADPVAIPAEASVEQAFHEFFWRYRWPSFPVVDAAGRLLGVVSSRDVEAITEHDRPHTPVRSLVSVRDDGVSWSVSDDAPLTALLSNPALRRQGTVMAVDHDGVLRGTVSADRIARALRDAVGASNLEASDRPAV